MAEIDALQTEFDKIRHIGEIVKGFRARIEALELRIITDKPGENDGSPEKNSENVLHLGRDLSTSKSDHSGSSESHDHQSSVSLNSTMKPKTSKRAQELHIHEIKAAVSSAISGNATQTDTVDTDNIPHTLFAAERTSEQTNPLVPPSSYNIEEGVRNFPEDTLSKSMADLPVEANFQDEENLSQACSCSEYGDSDEDSYSETDISDTSGSSSHSTWQGSLDEGERDALIPVTLFQARKAVIDRLMIEVRSLLNQHSGHSCRGEGSEASQPRSSNGSSDIQAESRINNKQKRRITRREGSEPPEDDGSDGDKSSKRKRVNAPSIDNPTRKFACPYYQRNPLRHQSCRSCAGPGWATVHRLK
jgi:hypothetical protein